MEIEAKFSVPDRLTFRRLARLRTLAGFTLAPAGTAQVTDRYFDAAGRRVLAGGYACRLRAEGDALLVTLKGVGDAAGAVHRRDEREAPLPVWSPDPVAWPESPARTLALDLCAGATLLPLFDLTQTRTRFSLLDGSRRVAEVSLDAVRARAGWRPASYYELEVELAPEGAEADLAAVVAELSATWGLAPEPRSKFARGLALADAYQAAWGITLTPEARAALEGYATGGDRHLAARGRAILARADGRATAEIAALCGLSAGRVRYWLRAFRAGGMQIFAAGTPPVAAVSEPAGEEPGPPPAPRPSSPLPSVTQFCRFHGVDLGRARIVASHGRALFDLLRLVHRLPRKRRRLLKLAALLNTIGAAAGPGRSHLAGRDLVLAQPLAGVSTSDRLALACIVAANGPKARPPREPAMAALDEKTQEHVMVLAAILRMAEALDSSRSQSTELVGLDHPQASLAEVVVEGPAAELDAGQATSRAGLWRSLFRQELAFVVRPPELAVQAEPAGEPTALAEALVESPVEAPLPALAEALPPPVPAPALVIPEIPPLQSDEPMSEAGRKVLLFHFGRMLANEAGTRLGQEIEALHDMRVATRRMRAAFQVFADYYTRQTSASFGKALRRAGRTLGAVRDLDVLLDKARAYGQGLPAELRPSFEPLLLEWETRREAARRQMLDYLDSPAYRRFIPAFHAFLTTPAAGAAPIAPGQPAPYQVRHVVPRLIFTRYEAVRAYEPLLPGAPLLTMHALRIDCKRLRYALEFFREVLGPEAPALIKQVVGMQDLLGELQDAYIAEGLVSDFLAAQRSSKKGRPSGRPSGGPDGGPDGPLEGVEAYRAALHAVQDDLLVRFPAPWGELVGPGFRRSLALAVAAL